jgi:FKBP-type peptidyl-prolyl cis-trans isomerase FklB
MALCIQRRTPLAVALATTLALGAAAPRAGTPAAAATPADTNSYSLGLSLGNQYRSGGLGQGPAFSLEALLRGIKDGIAGKALSDDERAQAGQYLRDISEALASRNQSQAQAFLAKNAKEQGVVTTKSGLEYQVLAAGATGAPTVRPNDRVTVQYRGRLLDGTEFDSSYSRGQPAQVVATNVIQGWHEALALMSTGARWRLFIPPELAYGAKPPTPAIPPNALLVFDVELLSIAPAAGAPAAAAN